MEGIVVSFESGSGNGTILADNQGEYSFHLSDWKSKNMPANGERVEFIAFGDEAVQISSIKRPVTSNRLGMAPGRKDSKISENLKFIFDNDSFNQLGVVVSFITIVSLFLPIIRIPMMGSAALIDGSVGKVLLVLLVIVALFFYSGFSRIYVKALTAISATIAFFEYYDLFKALSQINDVFSIFGGRKKEVDVFSLVQWGALINAISFFVLIVLAFVGSYKESRKVI